jgi:hypothetical protein
MKGVVVRISLSRSARRSREARARDGAERAYPYKVARFIVPLFASQ